MRKDRALDRARAARNAVRDELIMHGGVVAMMDPERFIDGIDDAAAAVAEELAELLGFLGATAVAPVDIGRGLLLCEEISVLFTGVNGSGELLLDPLNGDREHVVLNVSDEGVAKLWRSLG
jgi:hypothetical protein